MARLYRLFRDAPVLGSLIDPGGIEGDLVDADFRDLQPLLAQALSAERARDDEGRELGVVAQGLAKAAEILSGQYALVATNVPYLARSKQSEVLRSHCENCYSDAKNDVANVFLERCLTLTTKWEYPTPDLAKRARGARVPFGVVQVVMPQNWLFLTSYRKQRERLLRQASWNLLGRLGEGGFDSTQAAGAFSILLTMTNTPVPESFLLTGLDASNPRSVTEKAAALRSGELARLSQEGQLGNPDHAITIDLSSAGASLLSELADSVQGLATHDDPQFTLLFGCNPPSAHLSY